MLDTVKINHVQHISFTQSRLTDAVSVILRELLSYEHPAKWAGVSNAEKFHSCAATAMPIRALDEYGVFHCGCKCGIIHTSPAPGTRLCGVG